MVTLFFVKILCDYNLDFYDFVHQEVVVPSSIIKSILIIVFANKFVIKKSIFLFVSWIFKI
jgi:hypothetical protein